MPLKRFLYILFAATVLFTACKKDTGTNVNINASDLTSLNGQLKGNWVFPVQTQSIIDITGKSIFPNENISTPALQFDGSGKVKILPDTRTVLKGTYELTTDKGFIYLDVVYPDGTDTKYQVLLLNDQTLELTSSIQYIFYNGNDPVSASQVTSTVLKKQNSADVTGNFVRVSVVSDSLFNVGVYVKHATAAAGDTAILLNSQVNATGSYTYSFVAKHGDQLFVDVFGSLTKTSLNAYYNGLPFNGVILSQYSEIKTTTGWVVP
ncbi:MAG: hypothetical protein JWP37_788 [Mucilaginibacter sp.]|nr:hypothetical protein [Mucilaginibacter sp.]